MIKKIFICGTGAMASLFAAQLAQTGLEIVMFGTWAATIEKINLSGLQVVYPGDSKKITGVRAVTDASGSSDTDLVLMMVKSWQTEKYARELFGYLPPETPLLTLQNGLGNKEILGKYFGLEQVIQGVTTVGAAMLAPGEVRLGGFGLTTIEDHASSMEIGIVLGKSGLQVNIAQDTGSLIWGKMVISSAVNPLTALLGVANGELLNRPAALDLARELVLETSSVAAAQGINLPYTDPLAEVENVLNKTAVNISSMLQDVRRGSRTEIDAITGQIVIHGEKSGINIPVNKAMLKLVRAITNS